MRDALGLKPGVEVVLEVRGSEVVMSKPKIEGNYTEYYTSKLKTSLQSKRLSLKRLTEDLAYIDSNAFFDVSFLITFGESLLNN